jgi:4-aminobutyrate aminotransferase
MILKLPGPRSERIINTLKKLNVGYAHTYPFVHSGKGSGCYFYDIDGNKFLDFGSQIATNPLGYNDPELKEVVKKHIAFHPIKYAGQDFALKQHAELLEELMSITPKHLNSAMLVNSGAEAVENCLKLALRKQQNAKFGVAFLGAFHGRTLGALSCTSSNPIYKKNYLFIHMKHLPFNEAALDYLDMIIDDAKDPSEIGFVIVEPIQGEGGYNVASQKLMKGLREITKESGIPFIVDEVQSGMGRTGKWWAYEHYDVTPDVMSAAKALQVGAAVVNKSWEPEEGSISSTWGGGHVLDMALGIKTIEIIKRDKLINHNRIVGEYMLKQLHEIEGIMNVRGKGLMVAFDMPNKNMRNNLVVECLRHGLVVIGCGDKGIRLIPPYIVEKDDIDKALAIIRHGVKAVHMPRFSHTGKICDYLSCGEVYI